MALAAQQRAVATARPSARARCAVVARSRIVHGEHGHGDHHTPWYAKHKEMWTELGDKAALDATLAALPEGAMLVVDYYAPWCAVCKTAYPHMCRIADDPAHQAHYVFAKASLDAPEVKAWVKEEGIKGIPHLSVYDRSGRKVVGMGASFKKAAAIKHNLKVMAENKAATAAEVARGQLALDLDFHVIIPGATAEVAV